MTDWTGVAAAYRTSFGTLCAGTHDLLVAELTDGPLLDAGCGPGDLVGGVLARGREAWGVDADPAMVALAAARAPGRVGLAALPRLPFADGAFGAVAANFVVNHVPDPRPAMRELGRVLAREGRLAATVWPAGGAAWSRLVSTAFETAGVVAPPPRRLPAERDFERSASGLAGIALDAGLRVLDAREVAWTWHVAPDDLWRGVTGGVATAGATYRAQSPEAQHRATAAFGELAQSAARGGVLDLPCRAVLVVATH